MAILNKANIAAPVLPKETVDVPELGGEVVVRGLLLSDRLDLFSAADSGNARLTRMLASTVVDGDGEPIFTVEQWEYFGALHFDVAMKLFATAKRLSGLDVEAAEKN